MNCRWAIMWATLYAVGPVVPTALLADYYDSFNDGKYEADPNDPGYDPNVWDIDNPNWTIMEIAGDSFYYTAEPHALRLWVDSSLFPFVYLGATVDDGGRDPNTSMTYFDLSGSHYMLARVHVILPGMGMAGIFMHADFLHWTVCVYQYEPYDGWMSLSMAAGTEGEGPSHHRHWDPNNPHYYPDHPDPNDFWLLIQWDVNGSNWDPNSPDDPNDPNCHWLRGAFWNGEKFDWDGTWDLQGSTLGGGFGDPNLYYYTEGVCAVASYGGGDAPWPSDMAYDQIEVRWGEFSNVSRSLDLTVKNAQMGTITIDPDLLDDPNDASTDPNVPTDPGVQRRYTDGTAIVLVAEAIEGKSFKSWRVYDPNYPGDANHIVEDTNAVLYLTMNGDYQVTATFKCGSSELLLPLALALLALSTALAARRLR